MIIRAITLWLLFSAISFAGELKLEVDTSKVDCTAAIQALLNSDLHCRLPPGKVVRIDGTLYPPSESSLDLAFAKLTRGGSSTAPLVHIAYNEITVKDGWLRSANDSKNGLLHVGPKDPNKLANINFTRVTGITFVGNDKPGSIGLCLKSSEPQVGGSNYSGIFADNIFKFCDTSIDVGPQCNGHLFANTQIYHGNLYGIRFTDCSESSVMGIFGSNCAGMKAFIKAEGGLYCLGFGVQAEPGSGVLYDFDANCKAMAIFGHDNTGKPPIDVSQNPTFFSHGWLRTDKVTTRQK